MKKYTFHFRPNASLHLRSPTHALSLSLDGVDLSEVEALWGVEKKERGVSEILEGDGTEKIPLSTQWPGSWVGMAVPYVLHPRDEGNHPEFAVLIPDDVVASFTAS